MRKVVLVVVCVLALGASGAFACGFVPGAAWQVTGGSGYSTYTVTNSHDSGLGSLRAALLSARAAGGGIINFSSNTRFDIYPRSELEVPANTTIDGRGSRVEFWGSPPAVVASGSGLLNVKAGNVILIDLAFRDSPQKGLRITGLGASGNLFDFWVMECSFTNNQDEGLDITGANFSSPFTGNVVFGVTVQSSFFAGNGSRGMGGALLAKYGISGVSVYGNEFIGNWQRTPEIDGFGTSGTGASPLADVQFNYSSSTEAGNASMSSREGALVNFSNNFLANGDFTETLDNSTTGNGFAYFGGGCFQDDPFDAMWSLNTQGNPNAAPSDTLTSWPAFPCLPINFCTTLPTEPYFDLITVRSAGANQSGNGDPIDACYKELPVSTYENLRESKPICDAQ